MRDKLLVPLVLGAALLSAPSPATVRFQLEPEISLSPKSGVVGTTFSIQGRGFTPKGKVILSMFQPDEAILFGPPGSLKYDALSVSTDDQGRLTYTIESKDLKPGHYLCVALDEKTDAVSNRVFFTVIAPLELDSVFRPEVEKKLQAGFIPLQTMQGSLDGVHRHAAVVFAKMNSYRNDEGEEFSNLEDYQTVIYEQDGNQVRSFSDHDDIVEGSFQEIDTQFSFTDINGDGLRELLVTVKSGMVDSCSSIYTAIYQAQNHSLRRLALDCIRGIKDINHDGVYELILMDRWEFFLNVSRIASPVVYEVYRWKDGKYVNATLDFPEFYDEQLRRARWLVEKARKTVSRESDEFYVSACITLLLNYRARGQLKEGWQGFQKLMKQSLKTRAQRKARRELLKDFLKGVTSTYFWKPRYGEPIQK